MRAAEHVLVRVHTDDGVVGVADAPPRPFTYGETQAGVRAAVETLFAPAVVGLTLLEREVAHARMARTVGNPVAKAAVDMAMWDALGRTLGLPSPSSSAGSPTDAGQPHARLRHPGSHGRRGAADARGARDRHLQGQGGTPPVELDVAVVRALREGLGDSVELYVDGNRGWTASESARA